MSNLKIALIGRPNVGKSTLFNRLTGTKHAIVYDMPGVTRDRREAEARIADINFDIIDTPGMEKAETDDLKFRMLAQTEEAIEESDLIFFITDGRAGLTTEDRHFVKLTRKSGKPITLLVNKAEKLTDAELAEFYGLGLGDPLPISAEHNEGMALVYDVLNEFKLKNKISDIDQDLIDSENEHLINVAVLGRPNAGKSTLINNLIGEERLLTGPEAGITRDSISVKWQYKEKNFKLVDTAGVRKRGKVDDALEKITVQDSFRAVQYANIVVMLMDATKALETQDLHLASYAVKEGRGLVLVVNKWDLVEDKDKYIEHLKYRLSHDLAQVKGVKICYVSALYEKNLEKLMDEVIEAYRKWNFKVSTGKLNKWLEQATAKHQPPLAKNGNRIKLKYITQTKSRPPTLKLFISKPEELLASYIKYLINDFRDYFELPGMTVRILVSKNKNPYVKK